MKVSEEFGDDWEIIKHIFGRMNTDDFNYNYVIRNLCKYELLELFEKYYRYEDAIYNGELIYGPSSVIRDIIESYNFSFTLTISNHYFEDLKEYIKVIIKDEKSHLLVIKYMKKYNMDYKRWFK